jgi:hypothetical protein
MKIYCRQLSIPNIPSTPSYFNKTNYKRSSCLFVITRYPPARIFSFSHLLLSGLFRNDFRINEMPTIFYSTQTKRKISLHASVTSFKSFSSLIERISTDTIRSEKLGNAINKI